MRVLHIISSSGMYGAEAVILNLSRTLNSQAHHSILGVFSNLSNPNHQLHERALQEGIESHLLVCKGQLDRTTIAGIRDLAIHVGADVVHAHGYKADIYVYLALRGTAIPYVSTCHNWLNNDITVRLYGIADRFVLRNYMRVVAVSADVQQRLRKAGVAREKISPIRNGIDLQPFENATPAIRPAADSKENSLRIGLIGRLSPEKGIDIFLRAAALVLPEFPNARFLLVGEGPDRDKLELLIDELKMRDSISFLGRRDDMPSIYASLDVMVSASRFEGLPMAILEGMATGLPLVATAVGEVSTVVLEGRTGLLVKPEDPNALAEKILELLRDPAKRRRFGTAARKLIQQEYSSQRMTSDYLRIYSEAIAIASNKKNQLKSSPPPKGETR
jgi:glycosyltransferase involved in cell wall biosynthesis